MVEEDYRVIVINDTTMKVFRDGRIMVRGKYRKFTPNYAGYLSVNIGRTMIKVHKIVALTYLGERPEGLVIDHINGLNQDNSCDNLQYITHKENIRKRLIMKGRPVKGYTPTKSGKYKVCLTVDYNPIYLGTYITEEEARKVYVDAKLKYHNIQFEN